MNLRHLPTALRLIREARGLTRAEAADKIRKKTGIEVTPDHLSQWELGNDSPSVPSLAAFLDGLSRDAHDLAHALDQVADIPATARTQIEKWNARERGEAQAWLATLDEKMEMLAACQTAC